MEKITLSHFVVYFVVYFEIESSFNSFSFSLCDAMCCLNFNRMIGAII